MHVLNLKDMTCNDMQCSYVHDVQHIFFACLHANWTACSVQNDFQEFSDNKTKVLIAPQENMTVLSSYANKTCKLRDFKGSKCLNWTYFLHSNMFILPYFVRTYPTMTMEPFWAHNEVSVTPFGPVLTIYRHPMTPLDLVCLTSPPLIFIWLIKGQIWPPMDH